VGARQAALPPAGPGGGYLSSCNASGFDFGAAPAGTRRDPRIEELRRMGLRITWVQVAERIGFEAFVDAWQVLAANVDLLDDRGRITVPKFSTYHAFQRNQVIRSLAATGASAREIRDELANVHKLRVSTKSITAVLRKMER
jgi:hypothetical protein